MIKTLTITNIARFEKNPDGSPLKTKDGKPYTRTRFRAAEYGEQWISGFGASYNADWKAGDEVTVDITEVVKDGKTYLNFSKVNTEALLLERVNKLEVIVEKMRKALAPVYLEYEKRTKNLTSDGTKIPDFSEVDVPVEEELINPADIPFN